MMSYKVAGAGGNAKRRLASALVGFGSLEECADGRRPIGLIMLARLPAVVFGFAREEPLRHLFGTPVIAAIFLIVNGLVLFCGERLRRAAIDRADGNDLRQMSWRDALIVGLCQCGAPIPDISRSGATMVGGLLRGRHHEAAAHFSFRIATPIILVAAILEIPKMLHQPEAGSMTELALQSGLVAGIVAFLSAWFRMRYFKNTTFRPSIPSPIAAGRSACWHWGLLRWGADSPPRRRRRWRGCADR